MTYQRSAPKRLTPEYIVYTLFASNFIGIVFARTLHYQFYSWYFHTMPFLISRTKLPFAASCLLFFTIEWAYNVYPATSLSSSILQSCHLIILIALYLSPLPRHTAKIYSSKLK